MTTSSANIQRDAELERAELVNTLGQLRENLRPENMVHEVMANAKVSASDVTDRVWKTARENPIPAALIGIGAAMLMGVGQKLSGVASSRVAETKVPSRVAGEPDPYFPRRPSKADTAQRATQTKAQLSRKLDLVGKRASTAASQIADSASDLRKQATRKVSGYTSKARDGLGSISGEGAMSQYSRSRDQMTQTLGRLLDEQPLVLAALGIAVGAAIGAAIPTSDTEGQLMGEASGSVRQAARDMAMDQVSQLKRVASQTVEDVKKTAADHGLSTDNISGLVHDVGEHARTAAQQVGSTVGQTGASEN